MVIWLLIYQPRQGQAKSLCRGPAQPNTTSAHFLRWLWFNATAARISACRASLVSHTRLAIVALAV